MRAILVCVNYSDYLSITLRLNRHHFDQVVVVTSEADRDTRFVCSHNKATCFVTNAFYDEGAAFNKGKALEQGLDFMGREGVICIMDADIVWPHTIPSCTYRRGTLYTPLRRMLREFHECQGIPHESQWHKLPLHRQQREWAGYTQIFHADDPVLQKTPWYSVNWKHAGGSDSEFQARWNQENKHRPPFEVLHLGEAGQNWCGRVTEDVKTGEIPKESGERRKRLESFMQVRRRTKSLSHEKL